MTSILEIYLYLRQIKSQIKKLNPNLKYFRKYLWGKICSFKKFKVPNFSTLIIVSKVVHLGH